MILVDALMKYPTEVTKGLPGQTWCHMVSDLDMDELHAAARFIGCKREWFQGDHYDLTPRRRREAVENGAVEVTSRELLLRMAGERGDRVRARIAARAGRTA